MNEVENDWKISNVNSGQCVCVPPCVGGGVVGAFTGLLARTQTQACCFCDISLQSFLEIFLLIINL